MKVFEKEDIKRYLPAVISDLKHETNPELRQVNPDNIKRLLYGIAIRGMIEEDMGDFYYLKDNNMFIKGYVRDIWEYLQTSYNNIHNFDYTEICKWQKI